MSTNSKVRSHEPGGDLVAAPEEIRRHRQTPSLSMNAKLSSAGLRVLFQEFGNPNA